MKLGRCSLLALGGLLLLTLCFSANGQRCKGGTNRATAILQEPQRVISFVQISDPQLGLKHMYEVDPDNWADETARLKELVSQTKQMVPKPAFAFIGGDMQNYWPNEPNTAGGTHYGVGRNRDAFSKNHDALDDRFFFALEAKQIASVKAETETLLAAHIPVYYTAGNHDIGDVPDKYTLTRYQENWGPLQQLVFNRQGIVVLQLNSQLYWDSTGLDDEKAAQNAWLHGQLNELEEFTNGVPLKRLVLLTHIPPFMESAVEPHGWSNWKESDRIEVLGMISRKLMELGSVPMLWVCGHFHANVVKDTVYEGIPMQIRVSSSAGTTMQWQGKDELDSYEAMEVASKHIAGLDGAFVEDILDKKNGAAGTTLKNQRMQPIAERSGMRLFELFDDGSFKDKWFTVEALRDASTNEVCKLMEVAVAKGSTHPILTKFIKLFSWPWRAKK